MPRRLKALRPLFVDPGMSAAGLLGSIANPLGKAAAAPASSGPSGHASSQGWPNDGIPAQSPSLGPRRRGGAAGDVQTSADLWPDREGDLCPVNAKHESCRTVVTDAWLGTAPLR